MPQLRKKLQKNLCGPPLFPPELNILGYIYFRIFFRMYIQKNKQIADQKK
jgi:hypothetical protein